MNENLKEIWKWIPGYKGLYKASTFGRIKFKAKYIIMKNGKSRFVKGNPGTPGTLGTEYPQIHLRKNEKSKLFYVHRLIALTFLPNPKNKPEVNHIDGNKHNNHVNNLEWVTLSEQRKHAYQAKLQFGAYGSKSAFSKITEKNVKEIHDLLNKGIQQAAIAKKFKVSYSIIHLIRKGITWRHVKGFIPDKDRKNTKGENNGSAKLNQEQVKNIRLQLKEGKNIKDIAKEFSVTESAIGAIKYNRTWKWLK